MISKISINGFKSLEKVSLELGKLNIFIGANASGKTNFFEALRVLQGLSHRYDADEIFNGKPRGASNEVWEGIRGGCAQAAFMTRNSVNSAAGLAITLDVTFEEPDGTFSYSVTISAPDCLIKGETVSVGACRLDSPADVYPSQCSAFFTTSHNADWDIASAVCAQILTNTQQLEPSPSILRSYSTRAKATRMGDRGENFAALVKSILDDPKSGSEYKSWLAQLTPAEMDDVVILSGALQEPLFALKRGQKIFPAPVLSDGTLRFAAMAAAFFQQDAPELLMIEEIENGIHPTRLRLLMELLKSQSSGSGPQTIVTTHSPLVLAWLAPEDYRTTFFCHKDEETGASTITPLSEIPHFADIVKTQPVADLFAEGWMETAL